MEQYRNAIYIKEIIDEENTDDPCSLILRFGMERGRLEILSKSFTEKLCQLTSKTTAKEKLQEKRDERRKQVLEALAFPEVKADMDKQYEARRYQINIERGRVKRKRDIDIDVLPEVKPLRKSTTLQERLTVVRYALALQAKHKDEQERLVEEKDVDEEGAESGQKVRIPRRKGNRNRALKRNYRRGLNIELLCKAKFGKIIGGSKVCRWIRDYQQEKWELVPEKVRKTVKEVRVFYMAVI